MTDKEKIREEVQRLQDLTMDKNKNFYSEAAEGEYNALCNIEHFIDSLQEEPTSEDLEEAAVEAFKKIVDSDKNNFLEIFKAGVQWQKENLWKPADGDDLPEIDREVIVLTQKYPLKGSEYTVSFAHRPYKGKYIGKNLTTGNIETFENKTYDKGCWNQPDVRWWLDAELPKEIEL